MRFVLMSGAILLATSAVAATETYLIAPFEIILGNGAKGQNARCSVALGDGAVLSDGADHVLVEGAQTPKSINGLSDDVIRKINAQLSHMGYDAIDPAFVVLWNKNCGS